MCGYLQLLALWNRKLDLSGAKTASAQVEVLLVDPLVLATCGQVPERARVIDVGSGAGSPALPLALLRPDLTVSCVEPMRKRVAFLRTVVGSLGLADRVQVLEQRLDEQGPLPAGVPFDMACSRATFAPERWLPLGLRLAGRVCVLAGSASPPLAPAGSRIVGRVPYAVPSSGAPRAIVVYAASGASGDPAAHGQG